MILPSPFSLLSGKKIAVLLLAAFFLVTAAGCYDRREPDVLGIVSVLGIDLDAETGYIKVFASIANPASGGGGGEDGGGGGGGETPPFWVAEASGHTVFQAIKNLELISTRELRWSHIDVVLFSERLAREKGIGVVLDFLDRERQSRLISIPLLVRGDLKKFMESTYPLEQNSGEALLKQVRSIRLESARIPENDSLLTMFKNLSQPGRELALPLLHFMEGEESDSSQTGSPNPAKISGSALFKGDRLKDFFNERETGGYLWLTGNIKRATIVIRCPDSNEYLSVEIFEAQTRLEPVFQDGELRFKAFAHGEGRIQDYNWLNPENWDEEYVATLNRRLATAIRNQMEMSLDKARQAGVDVFGMGNILYRTHPNQWKELEDRWEKLFPAVAVDIEVETIIRRHGLVLDRIRIK